MAVLTSNFPTRSVLARASGGRTVLIDGALIDALADLEKTQLEQFIANQDLYQAEVRAEDANRKRRNAYAAVEMELGRIGRPQEG